MIKRVIDNDLAIVNNIVKLETAAFGIGGLNEWTLTPLIRHGMVFVFTIDEQIIGAAEFILDWDNREKSYLMGISIDQDQRGKGYGTTFLKGCLEILQDYHLKKVELTVDPKNPRAIAVYRKLGFIETGFRKDEYGKGEDRLVMEVELSVIK